MCVFLCLCRALDAGVRCPLLVLLPDARFKNVEIVTLLGALEALYVVSIAVYIVVEQQQPFVLPRVCPPKVQSNAQKPLSCEESKLFVVLHLFCYIYFVLSHLLFIIPLS